MIYLKYEKWKKIYFEILNDFGFSEAEDRKSALVLSKIVNIKHLIEQKDLKKIIFNKVIYVFGGGVNSKISKDYEGVLISANGATTWLLENNIFPDIIITDLDGKVEDQIFANKYGSIIVIHAHGDNIEALKKYVSGFKGKILCTTQCKPFSFLYNFGGFTDGDRAVFLAEHFGAKKIKLVGFDFEKVGRYSFSTNEKLKLKKLRWTEKLINIIDKSKIEFL